MRRLDAILRAIADAVDPPEDYQPTVPLEPGDGWMPDPVLRPLSGVMVECGVAGYERDEIDGETPFFRGGSGLYL